MSTDVYAVLRPHFLDKEHNVVPIDLHKGGRIVIPFPDGGTVIEVAIVQGRVIVSAGGASNDGLVIHPLSKSVSVVEPAQRYHHECLREALDYDDV